MPPPPSLPSGFASIKLVERDKSTPIATTASEDEGLPGSKLPLIVGLSSTAGILLVVILSLYFTARKRRRAKERQDAESLRSFKTVSAKKQAGTLPSPQVLNSAKGTEASGSFGSTGSKRFKASCLAPSSSCADMKEEAPLQVMSSKYKPPVASVKRHDQGRSSTTPDPQQRQSPQPDQLRVSQLISRPPAIKVAQRSMHSDGVPQPLPPTPSWVGAIENLGHPSSPAVASSSVLSGTSSERQIWPPKSPRKPAAARSQASSSTSHSQRSFGASDIISAYAHLPESRLYETRQGLGSDAGRSAHSQNSWMSRRR